MFLFNVIKRILRNTLLLFFAVTRRIASKKAHFLAKKLSRLGEK
jgi:hypothetical protein